MHSFVSRLIHCVWSTKIANLGSSRIYGKGSGHILAASPKQNQMKAPAIGGAADHVHILLSLPATLSIAKAVQLLKGNSSKWIRETFPKMRSFAWQEGYGAFRVGISGVDATVNYINNQTEHHRKRSFRQEFIAMLQKHHFEYESMLV
jgi:putative transposase